MCPSPEDGVGALQPDPRTCMSPKGLVEMCYEMSWPLRAWSEEGHGQCLLWQDTRHQTECGVALPGAASSPV